MIVGNNKPINTNNTFQRQFDAVRENAGKTKAQPYSSTDYLKSFDISDSKSMADKSFMMLEERLSNGTISLEEYKRQCEKLNKIRRQ